MTESLPIRSRMALVYQALGNREALHSLLLDFYQRMAADPMVGFFFDDKDLPAIASKQGAFLLRAMGVEPSYSGLPPAQAHKRLPSILPGHFDRRMRLLEATAADHGLPREAIDAWIAFEETFRAAVQA